MPYKYIGRTTTFKGKSLWEIVGNLKNFGIGRIVVRNMYKRYPELSYMKILQVHTLPNPEVPTLDDQRKVGVLVQRTFRGQTDPKPVLIESTSYKWDYQLIPKDQESAYSQKMESKNEKIYPTTIDFPPLLKEFVKRECKAKGEAFEDQKLELVYNKKSAKTKLRIAQEGETPNVKMTMGLGEPISPRLYEGLKL